MSRINYGDQPAWVGIAIRMKDGSVRAFELEGEHIISAVIEFIKEEEDSYFGLDGIGFVGPRVNPYGRTEFTITATGYRTWYEGAEAATRANVEPVQAIAEAPRQIGPRLAVDPDTR